MWIKTEAAVRPVEEVCKTVVSASGVGTEVTVGQQGLKLDVQ